tara:strand:- start:3806 stop:4345 length:540 start_codon:yes stop_codon:yes gene_type:complete
MGYGSSSSSSSGSSTSSTSSTSTGGAVTSGAATTTPTIAEKSIVKPFAAGRKKNTPLEDLVRSALTRAGNYSPSRIDGEVMMMFIELANRVIEEVRRHPYWSGGDIDYYNDPTECREIPDLVMIDGLTAHYFIQQGSEKAMVFLQLYQANLTDTLLERDIGNKKIEFNIKDGGSNKRYK